jgi:hypothetical protein
MTREDCLQDRLPEFEMWARAGTKSPVANGDCAKILVNREDGPIGRSFKKSATVDRNQIIRTRSRG